MVPESYEEIMKENLIGKNRSHSDSGDFTHRYFYLLRGCVPPPVKRKVDTSIQPISRADLKTEQQLAMDKARNNFNSKNKRKQ